MVKHVSFESNCKRIAAYIKRNITEPEVVMSGNIVIWVSSTLLDNFNAVGKKAFEKEINKHLKEFNVKYITKGLSSGWYLKFSILYI